MKTDPPQNPETVPKLIYTKCALILLEEQFCMTSKSLNFPSVDGTSKIQNSISSESISNAWNHLYSQQSSRLNAGPGFRPDGTR